ncbi:MAG: hypothetical protein HIU81_04040, partial [Acidobacteria bacterium]|nr:hypothetical protein [Acidobacteriota bacterium]
PRAAGLTAAEFLATKPTLDEFWTPLLVLDGQAMQHNIDVLSQWCSDKGFSLMPHGKTTMSPTLWQAQLDAGAYGITLATPGQIRTARTLGFSNFMLANSLTDPHGIRYVAQELADKDFQFVSWVDSVATVEAMEQALAGASVPRKINVCVELGAAGGRTGARSIAEARAVAQRVAESSGLRLAGVGGYEGALGHDRSEKSLTAVRAYLQDMLTLHEDLADLYDGDEVILTAGGSAYFDVVNEVFEPKKRAENGGENGASNTRYVLRSGAYITHDNGFYQGISPLDVQAGVPAPKALKAAMRGYARVVSHPEPGLALLDAGKRDFPYDEGLPTPVDIPGASISAMNDQHSFLRLPEADAGAEFAPVGSVVRLGLSHPCTAFDKWRVIPVVEKVGSNVVVDLVRTYF